MMQPSLTKQDSAPVAEPLRAYLASLLALGKVRQAGLLAVAPLGSFVERLGFVLLIPLNSVMFGWTMPDSRLGRIAEPLLAEYGCGQGLALILAGFFALMLGRALIPIRRDLGLFALSSELVDHCRGRMIAALVHAEWRQLRDLNRDNVEFVVTGDVAWLATGSD